MHVDKSLEVVDDGTETPLHGIFLREKTKAKLAKYEKASFKS